MKNEEKMKEAARKYAESLLGSEQFKNPQNKEFIDGCIADFESGVDWAAHQETISQAKVDEMAYKYANKVVGQPKKHQDAVEGVAHDFIEGVIWYQNENRNQQNNAFHKILYFFTQTSIGTIIGEVLLVFAFVGLLFLMAKIFG